MDSSQTSYLKEELKQDNNVTMHFSVSHPPPYTQQTMDPHSPNPHLKSNAVQYGKVQILEVGDKDLKRVKSGDTDNI